MIGVCLFLSCEEHDVLAPVQVTMRGTDTAINYRNEHVTRVE